MGELLVCVMVALIVLGPKRMPIAARVLGRWFARLKRIATTIREDIEQAQTLDEQPKQPSHKGHKN